MCLFSLSKLKLNYMRLLEVPILIAWWQIHWADTHGQDGNRRKHYTEHAQASETIGLGWEVLLPLSGT